MVKKARKDEALITIKDYNKYWIYEKEYGHDIVISCGERKMTIKCIWPDRKRDHSGRVLNK